MKKFMVVVAMALFICLSPGAAEAVKGSFTVTQTNPAPAAAIVNMGTIQTITFTITNKSGSGVTLSKIKFALSGTCTAPCTATLFSSATAAPAGWSLKFGTTAITFTASPGSQIPSGGSLDFAIVFNMGTETKDVTETLKTVQASFTGATASSLNNQGSWSLLSLAITSFQTVDSCATANPIAAIFAGNNFSLLMTVKNISSASQNGIVSNPSPPTMIPSLGITTTTKNQIPSAPTYTPNPLNLAAGASGTICFTYATTAAPLTDNGTISFTASVKNSSNPVTATSLSAPSNTLIVASITVSISVSGTSAADCIFSGDVAGFTMTIKNNSGSAINNVTPSVLTVWPNNNGGGGSVAVGAFTATSSMCINIVSGGTGTFTWTAPIGGAVGSPKPTFYVTGNINYNKASCAPGGGTTSAMAQSNTQDLDGYQVSVNPFSTNAKSANEELIWSITNLGCRAIQSVAISYPAGWTYGGGVNDAYSIINDSDDTWNISGANPTITFTPNPFQMSTGSSGDFSLVFSATPTLTGLNNFTVTITDANATPIVKPVVTTVTVNNFNDALGQGNYTGSEIWRENVQ